MRIESFSKKVQAGIRRISKLVPPEVFGERASGFLESLAHCCSDIPDRLQAVTNFERLIEISQEKERLIKFLISRPAVMRLLAVLFGSSQVLSEILFKNPSYLWSLDAGFLEWRKKEKMALDITESVCEDNASAGFDIIRRFKKKELFRIGLMELGGLLGMEKIMESLADLADVVVDATCRLCRQSLAEKHGRALFENSEGEMKEAGFAVIAMGKHGGHELNFSSDIDLMFVYEDDGETEGRMEYGNRTGVIGNHIYFTQLATSLVTKLEEGTAEGFSYRVDLRLRPEGKNGAIVRSLYSYESYYTAWGETWERQALIKMRVCAGDSATGNKLVEILQPFIYRKYMDIAAIKEIWHVKKRIDYKIAAKNATYHHVKLGYGGIREIEFIVQCFQLVYGGKSRVIRSLNTLKAISLLYDHQYLNEEDARLLHDGYLFLRNVESKLQIFLEQALHMIPDDMEKLAELAKKLNYRDYDDMSALDIFLKDYEYSRGRVRDMFELVFSETGEEKKIEIPVETRIINQHDMPKDEVYALLRKNGIENLEAGFRNLMMIAKGREDEPPYASKLKSLMENFLPLLLKEVSDSPDPDHALVFFETFLLSVGAKQSYIKFLLENQPIIKLLTRVFGSSEVISNIIISKPEFLDRIITAGLVDYHKSREDLLGELALEKDLDDAKMMTRIRDVKKQEMIRIGIRDILGLSPLTMVLNELSVLADLLVEFSYKCALWQMGKKNADFAILTLGKLGGMEMNYGSDLDLVMICKESAKEDLEYAGNLAGKIIELLSIPTCEGYAYKVDTRLRPFGSGGILVPAIEQFRTYLEESAETWERQAFTKVRFICGDASLGESAVEMIKSFVYSRSISKQEVKEIDHLRIRMEKELISHGKRQIHLKLSRGCLVDIQFIAQILQLRLGVNYPEVRTTSTLNALKIMREIDLTNEIIPLSMDDLVFLKEACIFLTAMESRLRIWEDKPNDTLPSDPRALNSLAKKMGFGKESTDSPQAELMDKYETCRNGVSLIYNKLISHYD